MVLDRARTQGPMRSRAGTRRARRQGKEVLIWLELFTGITATVGGALLAIRPDGSLLNARMSALVGSPFSDWRIPGVLLAVLVGGGFLGTALWQWRDRRYARELSLLAGLGLVVFESMELAWIGFQPLEAIFGGVGLAVMALAWRVPQPNPYALRSNSGR